MHIKKYYQSNYHLDLVGFMPDEQVLYFGHSWEYDCKGLERIPESRRPEFLICLYFTVLVDQAMCAHFRDYYNQFESLTKYPKFCQGLGYFQKNPRNILLIPIEKGFAIKANIDSLLIEGMRLFVDEVCDFFNQYMIQIKPTEFFDKLIFDSDVQIPTIITIVNPEMKKDTGVIAYEALRNAVESRKLAK